MNTYSSPGFHGATQTISVWAPAAERMVHLVADGVKAPMKAGENGWWHSPEPVRVGSEYAFSIDGGDPRPDPRSLLQPEGIHGPSEVVDLAAHDWQDDGWRGHHADAASHDDAMRGALEEAETAVAAAIPYVGTVPEPLAEAPDTPTLIFMHHPPVVAGIDWMDPAPEEGWIVRLRDVLEGQHQVLAIHCGHLHRQIGTRFAGIPLGVTPSVAPLVAMDLNPIDKDVPDDRELITTEPPTYAIHRWDGAALVSHYERVGDWQVLARFHAGLQPMIEGMFAERD